MNKYITLHDTIDQRESVVLDYTNTPHVSYTGEDDKVEYTKELKPQTSLWYKIDGSNLYIRGTLKEGYSESVIYENDAYKTPSWTNNTNIVTATIEEKIYPISLGLFFFQLTNLKNVIGFDNVDDCFCVTHTGMAYKCSNLQSLDCSHFTGRCSTNIRMMFAACSSLEHINLSNFNMSNVINMNACFQLCSNITTIDVSNFNTSKVTDMSYLFNNCEKLKDIIGISNLDVSNATSMRQFFYSTSIETLNLSKWNVSKVESFLSMFAECSKLKNIVGISNWNVSNATNLSHMFDNCEELQTLDLSNWNVSNVTTTLLTFANCIKLKLIKGIGNWNLKNCTTCKFMFGSDSDKYMTIERLDVSNLLKNGIANNISSMFQNCIYLKSIGDISNWNVSNVTTFNSTFRNCKNLKSIGNISNWNVSSCTSMNQMFARCNVIRRLGDLSNWNVSNVTDFTIMFGGYTNPYDHNHLGTTGITLDLTSLGDLTKWNTSKATTFTGMFQLNTCDSVYIPNIPKNANTYAIIGYGHGVDPTIKHIIKSGKISSNMDVDGQPLTHESALILIDALDPEVNCTLTLSSVTYNTLTDEEKKVATDKGWTIAVLN